jgi:hypothetical protein
MVKNIKLTKVVRMGKMAFLHGGGMAANLQVLIDSLDEDVDRQPGGRGAPGQPGGEALRSSSASAWLSKS